MRRSSGIAAWYSGHPIEAAPATTSATRHQPAPPSPLGWLIFGAEINRTGWEGESPRAHAAHALRRDAQDQARRVVGAGRERHVGPEVGMGEPLQQRGGAALCDP